MPEFLLPWNPSQTNCESDAAYLADTTRLNGFAASQQPPSPLLNKFLYQAGVLLAALQQYFLFKGVTCDDGTGTLFAALKTINSANDQLFFATSMITNASPALDARRYGNYSFVFTGWKNFQITLDANAVTPTISGFSIGDEITFVFIQSASFTWTWPSNVLGGGTVSSTPGSYSIQQFKACDDGNLRAISALIVS